MTQPFRPRALSAPSELPIYPEPPTWPEGWYPVDDDGMRLRWWDGRRWTSQMVASAPGWYEHPVGSGVSVYFDGERWTSRVRRRAARAVLGWMTALAVLGTGLVIWGGVVVASIPAWSYPDELTDYYCSGTHNGEFFSGIGWLIVFWVLLVVVGAVSFVVWRRAGLGDWRVSTLAILGIVSIVVLCPIWLVVGAGANCGL